MMTGRAFLTETWHEDHRRFSITEEFRIHPCRPSEWLSTRVLSYGFGVLRVVTHQLLLFFQLLLLFPGVA